MYSDRQAWVNSLDQDQTPQNADVFPRSTANVEKKKKKKEEEESTYLKISFDTSVWYIFLDHSDLTEVDLIQIKHYFTFNISNIMHY